MVIWFADFFPSHCKCLLIFPFVLPFWVIYSVIMETCIKMLPPTHTGTGTKTNTSNMDINRTQDKIWMFHIRLKATLCVFFVCFCFGIFFILMGFSSPHTQLTIKYNTVGGYVKKKQEQLKQIVFLTYNLESQKPFSF